MIQSERFITRSNVRVYGMGTSLEINIEPQMIQRFSYAQAKGVFNSSFISIQCE